MHHSRRTERYAVLHAHHGVIYVVNHAVERVHGLVGGHTVVHVGGHVLVMVAGLVGGAALHVGNLECLRKFVFKCQ